MEWWIAFIIIIGSMVILLLSGIPVFIAFFSVAILFLVFFGGIQALTLLPGSILDSTASFVIIPVPLFMLLGEMLFRGGWVDIVFEAADNLVGRIRSRMFIITLMSATFLGAISGSAMAMAAALGSAMVPAMISRGYDKKLTYGTILGGALLDPIIPPTILGVVLASLANVSVSGVMLGGILPGVTLAGLYILYTMVMIHFKPEKAPATVVIKKSLSKKVLSFIRIMPLLLLIFLVLGLMGLGVVTPSESAATGAIGAIILNAIYGRISFKDMKEALLATARTSGMVLIILAASRAFSQVLGLSGVTEGLVRLATQIDVSPTVLLVCMLFVVFFLGCFVDQISIIMICVPIFLPIVNSLGFEPIWFWVIFLCNLSLGGITPPFGLLLYVLKGTFQEASLEDIFKSSLPFIVITIIGMIILIVFPSIITFLPNAVTKAR